MPYRTRRPIGTVIVEQETLYRDLLGIAVAQAGGLRLLGAFADGEELLREAMALAPDVAVLDIDLPGQNGIGLATRLRRILPDLGIVLLVEDRDVALLSAMPENRLHQWSYLVNKGSHTVTALLRAIQVTHARLLNLSEVEPPVVVLPKLTSTARFPELTTRQREILGLLAQGFTNRAIADTLQLKEKTIENQLGSIYDKFEMNGNRTVVHSRVWAALRYHDAAFEDGRSD